MTDTDTKLEIAYVGQQDLYVKLCRTPRGKLYLHMGDTPTEFHGEGSEQVPVDGTMLFTEGDITDVDS